MQRRISRSLKLEKIKSMAQTLQESESFGPALLVGAASLFFFLAIPFYGIYASIILAAICAAAAYYRPNIGAALMLFAGLFAIAHQSTGLAWLYAFVFMGSAVLEMRFAPQIFDWRLYAYTILVVGSAFSPIPFAGAIAFIAFAFGCLQLGSERSIVFSLFSISCVMLLSSLWGVPNGMGLFVGNGQIYAPYLDSLMLKAHEVPIQNLVSGLIGAAASMLSFAGLQSLFEALGKSAMNLADLLIRGPLLMILGAFCIGGYAIGYLPAKLKKNDFRQAISSAPILLGGLAATAASIVYGGAPQFAPPVFSLLAIGAAAALDVSKTNLSREEQILANQAYSKFGKFGEEKAEIPNVKL
ncbi:MAG: hypothetical protein V1822_00225, partial [Candidatus Micrarchaeota archaeon]